MLHKVHCVQTSGGGVWVRRVSDEKYDNNMGIKGKESEVWNGNGWVM